MRIQDRLCARLRGVSGCLLKRRESERFHDLFDVLFRAVLDLLEFLVLAEFSKASFNHVEEFVDVLQKSCDFFTDLSCVQF